MAWDGVYKQFTANRFMLFTPLEGWEHVEVADRHTRLRTDSVYLFVAQLKDLESAEFSVSS